MTISRLAAAALVAVSGHAGPALSQNMALTPAHQGPPDRVEGTALPHPWPEPPPRPAILLHDGSLPNQRTGPARPPRVVRDICIGCDR